MDTQPYIIAVPEHWPPRHNANNEPCDLIKGPCLCGAWHSLDELWVKNNIEEFGKSR